MKRVHYRQKNKRLFLLKVILTLLLVIFVSNNRIKAQTELDVIWQRGYNQWLNHTDAPNSLYNYLARQVYDLLDKREAAISDINSLSDWQRRQEYLHETLKKIVGTFPEKTALNAKITRTIKKDNFSVEHIIFESRPGYYVTSSLFIPSGLKRNSKTPVVIYCSGHSVTGYHNKGAQTMILNLVKKGIMVFAFDPVGQGERIEYLDPKTGVSVFRGPTIEHSYPGSQTFITGSSMAQYMMWDGIRAVDYLLTRKDIDPARIGITGCSGGGTQTAFIAALDDRIYAAAPQCYITSYRRLFQSIGPQDAEQNLINSIFLGLDHGDLLSVRAPKPAIVLSTTEDMFSIQGARETTKEVMRIYKAYGKEDNFSQAEDGGPHGSTKKTRQAMYAFFQKHFNTPGKPDEEEVSPLSDEEMKVTTTGQVVTSLRGESVFSLNSKEAAILMKKLQTSRTDTPGYFTGVQNSAKKLSGYHEPATGTDPVFTGHIQRDGYVIEKYFVMGEGDYVIPYLLMVPDKPNNKAIIYLHPSGKAAEASAGGEMEWFVKNGFKVLAPDMIGIGETGPGAFKGDANIDGYSHNLWYASFMIGRSIVGIRAGDVVRLTRLLQRSSGINEIYGVARKEMAPVLLHAAAFEKAIARIALVEPFSSYNSIIMNRLYSSAFIHSVVPGAINAYDLPDLASILVPRKLMMAGVTDGSGKSTDIEAINNDMALIRTAYQNMKAEGQLKIMTGNLAAKPYGLFLEWIK